MARLTPVSTVSHNILRMVRFNWLVGFRSGVGYQVSNHRMFPRLLCTAMQSIGGSCEAKVQRNGYDGGECVCMHSLHGGSKPLSKPFVFPKSMKFEQASVNRQGILQWLREDSQRRIVTGRQTLSRCRLYGRHNDQGLIIADFRGTSKIRDSLARYQCATATFAQQVAVRRGWSERLLSGAKGCALVLTASGTAV